MARRARGSCLGRAALAVAVLLTVGVGAYILARSVKPRMGLEEDQETFILDRVEGAISDSRKMLDMSDEMEKIFAGIHDNLQSVVEQQNQLLLSMDSPDNESASASGDANDTQADDVELF